MWSSCRQVDGEAVASLGSGILLLLSRGSSCDGLVGLV